MSRFDLVRPHHLETVQEMMHQHFYPCNPLRIHMGLHHGPFLDDDQLVERTVMEHSLSFLGTDTETGKPLAVILNGVLTRDEVARKRNISLEEVS